jgi:hypothetical protein
MISNRIYDHNLSNGQPSASQRRPSTVGRASYPKEGVVVNELAWFLLADLLGCLLIVLLLTALTSSRPRESRKQKAASTRSALSAYAIQKA